MKYITKKQTIELGNQLADDMGWTDKSRTRKLFVKLGVDYIENDPETDHSEMLGFYSGVLAVGPKFQKFGSYRF